MDLAAIANQTIPAASGKKVLKKEGKTDDIIAEVIAAFMDSREQLRQFAPHLKAATLLQTLQNVWSFWKGNIKYKVDPSGQQWVQEPARLWEAKEGDCKSLSIAVMATLYALDIKAAFRFASYNGNNEFPTHVYVIVKDQNKIIPVDCVWKAFGEQKPFTKNWDYDMTKIFRLSGFDDTTPQVGNIFTDMRKKALANKQLQIQRNTLLHQRVQAEEKRLRRKLKPFEYIRLIGNKKLPAVVSGTEIEEGRKKLHQCKCHQHKPGATQIPDDPRICEGIAGLILLKNGLELEQQIHAEEGGIGSTYDNAYTIQITGLHNVLAPVMGWKRKRLVGHSSPKQLNDRNHAICGITDKGILVTNGKGETYATDALMAQAAADAIEYEIGSFFGSIWKGIKSVGKAIGKGAKAIGKGIVKVVKTPFTLIGKGIKAVGKLIGKALTAPARKAINEQLPGYGPFFLYTFIVDPKLIAKLPAAVKIKKDKAEYYKKIIVGKLGIADTTFDQVVRNSIMQQFKMTPEQTIAKWIKDTNFQVGFLGAILGAAAGLLGKGLKAIVGDTGENIATDAEQYAPAVEDWGTLTEAARAEYSGQVTATAPLPLTQDQLYQQYPQPAYQAPAPAYNYQAPAPTNDYQPDFSGGGTPGNDYGQSGGTIPDYPDAGSKLAIPQDLNNVDIRPQESSSNGLMIALVGFGLLAAASSSKGRKKTA